MTEPRARKPRPPLNAELLQHTALRYVERFATSRAKLAAYLGRKVRERGWADDQPPELERLVEQFAALGYVDDREFAVMKARSLGARGYGARRVHDALRQAGIAEIDRDEADRQIQSDEIDSALRFARKKRVGPYGSGPLDRLAREKALSAMVRAGHRFDMAQKIVDLEPDEDFDVASFRQNW